MEAKLGNKLTTVKFSDPLFSLIFNFAFKHSLISSSEFKSDLVKMDGTICLFFTDH